MYLNQIPHEYSYEFGKNQRLLSVVYKTAGNTANFCNEYGIVRKNGKLKIRERFEIFFVLPKEKLIFLFAIF